MKKINDTGSKGPAKLSKANTYALTPVGFNLLQLIADATTADEMAGQPAKTNSDKTGQTKLIM